jgi:hypothetical protein
VRINPIATTQPVLTAIALLAVAVAAWILAMGGVQLSLFDVDIRATRPLRPLAVAAVAFALRMAVGGVSTIGADIDLFVRVFTPRRIAIALVAAAIFTGVATGSDVAGGADFYGYISQADLWLRRELVIAQPAATTVPWPDGQWTFAPLGYRPSPSGDAIVPTYAVGFPLLLALFKYLGGQCAVGWVVPAAAGLLIGATFAIGRKAVSADVGAAAAWLMATSPVVLFSMMSPMSDIPAAAFWALAVYGCLTGTVRGALLGGVAAAVAVLIRPNLAHVGVLMAVWLALRDWKMPAQHRFGRVFLFALPLVAGGVAVAMVNAHLYGSPTRSGYGQLNVLFSVSFFAENVKNYTFWIVSTQTPLALLGLLAIVAPLPRWVKSRPAIEGRSLLALMVVGVIGTYLFYLSFGEWWYLRFLLPMWPALCVGTASLVTVRAHTYTRTGVLILLCLGGYGLWYAQDAGTFNIGRNERRYISVAHLIRDTTEPNSVIITLQHSGSLRYYGGRTTLRYDQLNARWLDRSIAWLHANGFRPYILLDDGERQEFVQKFASRNEVGDLDIAIVAEYRDRYNTSTLLYDPLHQSHLMTVPVLKVAPRRHARNCEPSTPVQPIFSMENARR